MFVCITFPPANIHSVCHIHGWCVCNFQHFQISFHCCQFPTIMTISHYIDLIIWNAATQNAYEWMTSTRANTRFTSVSYMVYVFIPLFCCWWLMLFKRPFHTAIKWYKMKYNQSSGLTPLPPYIVILGKKKDFPLIYSRQFCVRLVHILLPKMILLHESTRLYHFCFPTIHIN